MLDHIYYARSELFDGKTDQKHREERTAMHTESRKNDDVTQNDIRYIFHSTMHPLFTRSNPGILDTIASC